MSDQNNYLDVVLEHLRRIEAGVDAMKDDMREINERLSRLEAKDNSISLGADHLESGVEHIESRLKSILIDDLAMVRHHFQTLKVIDPRPADEILGYDEHGLPR